MAQRYGSSKFTKADSNRVVQVVWIPGQGTRAGRVINWNDYDKDGKELITVRFEDTGMTARILASQACRITPQIAPLS